MKHLQVADLIEQCDQILEALSGYYSGNPDLQSAKKAIGLLNRHIIALDARIAKVLPYYSSRHIGHMGWSKKHIKNALLQIEIGSGYNARSQLISARESLQNLDRALMSALT